ncbi:hypothetical protein Poly51_10430 [Rubripirellula tenax]|uniref:Cytochrome c domain-containing protein n=1 Tax=Rubripirellula tenax TaxID=2528015 RepID=A0A5C6FMN1_9BACT|nr:PVC-type heme-binding CxxCH protein [Rubripirellula tenax]TWU60762.1 hypothetical protein Poly51_10430 [Rubripirellula tenax]
MNMFRLAATACLFTIFVLCRSAIAEPVPVASTSGEDNRQAAADHAVVQALLRIPDAKMSDYPASEATVSRHLRRLADANPSEYVSIAGRLGVTDDARSLLAIATGIDSGQAAIDSVRLLEKSGQLALMNEILAGDDEARMIRALTAMGHAGGETVAAMVMPVMNDASRHSTVRSAAAEALGHGWHGQQELLKIARANKVPDELKFEISNALLGSWTKEIAAEAKGLASLQTPVTSTGETFPPVNKLQQMSGDPDAGKVVFNTVGTCNKCHKVLGEGKEVGPDLSEIGSKLSRLDMHVAILNPSAAISHNYETYAVLTADGQLINGILVNQTDEGVTIKTADAVLKTIAADDIEEIKKQEVSLMPADLQKAMTVQNLVDLVDYLSLLLKPDEKRFNAVATESAVGERSHDAASSIQGFDVASGLTVQLFASEPQMYSPTSIDVDHLGRVWVCEAINYRAFRNPHNQARAEGDRILVMEDVDHDGGVDKTTVFYQGNDIDSPHGVCVLGDRVIVSAGANVFSFRDTDGDLKPDEKKLLFTGISGVQHDHGIHSFMPGPDGKLYFNFGNEGKQIRDANGQPIIDLAGNEINDSRQPYQMGMVFRCDADGSNVETLGWNFRNNWEVCVDSFGTMWQSDNDDDGNQGTRINYVMEYGNYGYRNEKTGDYWQSNRIGLEDSIGKRHWHLNDPGVVPNLLQTGAGSPTGIMFYEGELLPPPFRNQIVHTDPGPNVVRAYPIADQGAGYSATIENMIKGVRDQWFRPVDVCTAPDGSVIVADWYDPGVGGHRMGDTERGRCYRITVPGHEQYSFPAMDLATLSGASEALASPNQSTRYLAGKAITEFWKTTPPNVADLLDASKVPSAPMRARWLWLLSKTQSVSDEAIERGINDSDVNLRITAIRAARQAGRDMVEVVASMVDDPSPQVRRELAIALRGEDSAKATALWTDLAVKHDGADRWYLEALGVAAEGNWDACFASYIDRVGDQWDSVGGCDIVWRARTQAACQYLAKLIKEAKTSAEQERYFRALDFFDDESKKSALQAIASQS